MKKLLVLLALSLCFIGCSFDSISFKTDSEIVGHTFQQIDEYTTSVSPDSSEYIKAVCTETLKFNEDKTVDYTRTYNKEALANPNLTNCSESGTYIVNRNKEKLEMDGLSDGNFNRRFDYRWNTDGELELHVGFMDQTLFLCLTKMD